MASNQSVNKVVYAGRTLIDLTADSVTPDTLLYGHTAHNATGQPIIGTYIPGHIVPTSWTVGVMDPKQIGTINPYGIEERIR